MFLTVALLVEVAVVGGLLLIQPRVVRRGLLFGVYVGEERWQGEQARVVTRRWTHGMLGGMAASVIVGLLLPLLGAPAPVGVVVATLVLLAASYGVYLRAYFAAKKLAAPGPPPAAAAALIPNAPYSLLLPLLSLVVAVAAGAVAVAYTSLHYQDMPGTIPTHFGPSGRPDAWSPRSFWAVMLLPLTALLVSSSLAVTACLTARAKRAIRRADSGISIGAQMRFREATARFLSGVAILAALMMSLMSVFSARTALGLSTGLPPWTMAVSVILIVYALAGTLYIAIRYGQGGARLERHAAGAPLTNGVADNSCWYLGGFYVNRDDPSILVEKRFGIGYTINFGNPKAVALLVVFLVVIAAIVINGMLTPQTHVAPVQ